MVFYALPYNFPTVLQATSARVCCNASASVYTVSLRMFGTSTFAFKFFKIIYRYAKRSRTWNMFFFSYRKKNENWTEKCMEEMIKVDAGGEERRDAAKKGWQSSQRNCEKFVMFATKTWLSSKTRILQEETFKVSSSCSCAQCALGMLKIDNFCNRL